MVLLCRVNNNPWYGSVQFDEFNMEVGSVVSEAA